VTQERLERRPERRRPRFGPSSPSSSSSGDFNEGIGQTNRREKVVLVVCRGPTISDGGKKIKKTIFERKDG